MEVISKIYTFLQLQPAFVPIARDFWRLSEPVVDSKFDRASHSFAYRSDVGQSPYLATTDEEICVRLLLLERQAKREIQSRRIICAAYFE